MGTAGRASHAIVEHKHGIAEPCKAHGDGKALDDIAHISVPAARTDDDGRLFLALFGSKGKEAHILFALIIAAFRKLV